MDYKYTFTVFTTTYDRAYILHRVYESLKPQAFRDFEWLIADNGSSDNTKELVNKWIQEADFPIRLISWENNIGFNGAVNRGVQEARGKFFLPLDSDDACTPNTLEGLNKYWELIPDESKDSFSGVTSLCVDQHGNMVCGKFPRDITDSDSLEMRYKYKVSGEMWGFQKTDVLKNHPLPGSTEFIPVGIVWNKIGRKYKTRFINQIYRTWYINEPDRDDQTSFDCTLKSRAPGGIIYYIDVLNNDTRWFRHAPYLFFRSAVIYSRFSLHLGVGFLDQMKKLNNSLAKFLLALAFPAGVLVFLKEKFIRS